jgi:FimV-like protein
MLLGAGIAAVAAFLGLRFGEDLGFIVVVLAAVLGALVARGLAGTASSRVASPDQDEAPRELDEGGDYSAGDAAAQESTADAAKDSPSRISLFAEPGPGEPDWPVETDEVRLKLDLAKEYLDAEHPELASDMLQEVLELEVQAARKVAVEILRGEGKG